MERIFAEPSKPLTTRLALPILLGGCYGASGVLEIEDMESKDRIINIGQYDSSQNSRVVSSEGISYAVTNGHKDGMPKIIQEAINTDANGNAKAIRACYGQCGYDSVFRGTGQGITGVMEEIEPKIIGYSRDKNGDVVSRHLKEVANTVHTFTGGGWNTDQFVAEPNVLRQERTEECKKLRRINGDKGMKFNAGNKAYYPRTDGMSNTLSTSTKDNMLAVPELRAENGCLIDKDGNRYRIRKLTPTECFRLQDVSDEDIEKIRNYRDIKTAIICDANGEPIMNMDFDKPAKNSRKITIMVNGEQREYYRIQLIWQNKGMGISKTAQYKLAGNSICVAPMYHIFRKLFIEKECENQQLELF